MHLVAVSGKNVQNKMVEIKEGHRGEKAKAFQSDSVLLTPALRREPAALPTRTFGDDRNVLGQLR